IAHRKLFHKSPPVSFVTERLVKLVGIFPGKPRVHGDAPDSSLSEIFLRSRNQRATNSAAAHRTQCRKGKNSAAGIVMLIAWARECADHPAHFAIKHRHKCAIVVIGSDP